MAITIQRLIKAKESLGISRSTFYLQIAEGLITKPVQIGARAVGWPSNEIETILNARIAGKTSHEIKALVKELESLRANVVDKQHGC
ncbi:MAG TPA: transcriptional regulator [Methylophilaceae bacterium]|nr:transcriptional regulator [Methylophilaceae bacterium]HAJ71053.1 transcriptional regulator [Methylophilaceae bacterium]